MENGGTKSLRNGRFMNRPYNLFKHPDNPKFESRYTKCNERVYGVENGYMVTKYTFIDKL